MRDNKLILELGIHGERNTHRLGLWDQTSSAFVMFVFHFFCTYLRLPYAFVMFVFHFLILI
jgi:hypothetical protein